MVEGKLDCGYFLICFQSVAYVGHDWKRYYQLPLGLALASSNQKLTWTKTVRELLFDGFDNAIQNIASYIPGFPALDKFGWFYKVNQTNT